MARFATAAELQTFLGGSGINTTRAEFMLDRASALIRMHTGQTLDAFTGAQEAFGPTTLDRLFLTQRPVTAVTSVVVDGSALGADDFVWTRWGTVYLSGNVAWAWQGDETVVTYDGGYAPGSDEMEAIKTICLEAATRAYTRERDGVDVMGLDVPEAVGWTPHLFLTAEEKGLLAQFGAVAVG
jgi:hypothetical protein